MNYSMDETDERILALLRENARYNYSEIGSRVGLSRVAVKNRVAAMEESGIIEGYHATVNAAVSPEATPFYIFVETKTGEYMRVMNYLKNSKTVTYLFQVMGTNSLMAICVAKDHNAMSTFLWNLRTVCPGITSIGVKDIIEVVKGTLSPV